MRQFAEVGRQQLVEHAADRSVRLEKRRAYLTLVTRAGTCTGIRVAALINSWQATRNRMRRCQPPFRVEHILPVMETLLPIHMAQPYCLVHSLLQQVDMLGDGGFEAEQPEPRGQLPCTLHDGFL